MRRLVRRFLIAAAIFAVCLPLSFIAGIATFPFWSWIEARFGIEAVGHSGPAEWCFWTLYALLAGAGLLIFWRVERQMRG